MDWSDDMCEWDVQVLHRILCSVLVIGCGELKVVMSTTKNRVYSE